MSPSQSRAGCLAEAVERPQRLPDPASLEIEPFPELERRGVVTDADNQHMHG